VAALSEPQSRLKMLLPAAFQANIIAIKRWRSPYVPLLISHNRIITQGAAKF
jgi:hypothetical protein